MIKRNLLRIGLILTLSFTLLTGCRNKDNTTAEADTSTTIDESTSERESESESATEKETTTKEETTTEVETQKVAEATQPVTAAPKPAVTEAPKPAVTEAPKPAVTESPKGSFDNPISADTPKKVNNNTKPAEPVVVEEDHSRDDYNWAVKKVAEWKKINPDPAYLIGMFGCYARSNWYYSDKETSGKWGHALSYYKTGVCDDIEFCFRTFCNVAGIPCERIEDWENYEDGHTWDRVTIDGVQYDVDMTGSFGTPSELGKFESFVTSFNTRYYGNDEFQPNRLYALSKYEY